MPLIFVIAHSEVCLTLTFSVSCHLSDCHSMSFKGNQVASENTMVAKLALLAMEACSEQIPYH